MFILSFLFISLSIPTASFLQNTGFHTSNKYPKLISPRFLNPNQNRYHRQIQPNNHPQPPPPSFNPQPLTPLQKIQKWIELLRPSSLPPTFLLCMTGGWLMNPSFQNLFHSTQFIAATACTLLITSTSMIINDMYDIQHDKIDHPTRPLPSGVISLVEAGTTLFLLLGAIDYLSTTYLRTDLQWIIQLSTAIVFTYTPILKRIPLVKNVSCAFLVSLSLFFTGLSASTTDIVMQLNFPILCLAMSSVFFGSLYNELILDMRDTEGDRVNHVYTLPVLLGLPVSYGLLVFLTYFNFEWVFLSIYYLFGISKAFGYLLCYSPLVVQVNNIRKKNYSKRSLIQASKASNIPLILVMLYFCVLAVL